MTQRQESFTRFLGKPGKFYPVFCASFAVLMLFFLSSGWWFPDLSSSFSSPVGQQQKSSSNVSITLLKWQYNPSTEYAEAWFSVEDSGSNPRLDFSVSARAAVKKYDASVLWWQDGILAVSVSFPMEEKIKLEIRDNISRLQAGESFSSESAAAEFNAAAKELPQNVYLSPEDRDLRTEGMEIVLLAAAQQIPETEKKIEQKQKEIENLKQDVDLLREEEAWQTDQEIQNSEAAIAGKESQILSLQEEIRQLEIQRRDSREKLLLLLKKMQAAEPLSEKK